MQGLVYVYYNFTSVFAVHYFMLTAWSSSSLFENYTDDGHVNELVKGRDRSLKKVSCPELWGKGIDHYSDEHKLKKVLLVPVQWLWSTKVFGLGLVGWWVGWFFFLHVESGYQWQNYFWRSNPHYSSLSEQKSQTYATAQLLELS